jgi:hypothetical protein
MRIIDLVQQAPLLYKTGRAVHLVGPPGIGKSDTIEISIRNALSQAYGEEFGFWDFLAPTVDAPDVRGFLVPTKLADGTPSSFYTRSGLLPPKEYLEKYPRGIYFIDERNSADVLTQKALAPAILHKRFGDVRLPEGWQMWSASNRVSDQSGASKALKMMVNRERTIYLQSDVLSWSIWAEERRLHPLLIAFAKARPAVVFPDEVPKGDGPFCTARSFTATCELLGEVAGVDANGNPSMKIPMDNLVMQLVQGDIGEASTAELAAHIKLGDQLPEIEEIEKDPMAAKCPKDLSAAYAAAQMLLHYAKPGNIDMLWTYAERLPREIQVSTAQSLVKRGAGVLLNSAKLTAWITKNQALIHTSSAKK